MSTLTTPFLVLISALMITGCGGGGGGTETTGTGDTGGTDNGGSTPPVTPPQLTNTPVLFLVTSSSTSDYIPGYDITLQSNTQTIIRYVPETGFADIVDDNYAPSYAGSQRIVPYTVDDRFLVRREWESFEINGYHEFTEYDPVSGTQLEYFRVNEPYYFSDGCSALVGGIYYYRRHRNYDFLYGDIGGDFRRYVVATSTDSQLFPYGTTGLDMCKNHLWADNGELFDGAMVVFNPDPTVYYGVFNRNLTTGGVDGSKVAAILADLASYEEYSYQSGVSGGIAYIARKRISDNAFEIWSGPLGATPTLIYQGNPGSMTNLHYFDVDDGYVVIGDQSAEQVFLFDANTATGTVINTGMYFYSVEVLYVPE